MSDQIVRYLTSVADANYRYCSTCGVARPTWSGITEGGDTLVCCGTCQRVLDRMTAQRVPAIPDPEPPIALVRKTGVIGADTPQQVALAVAQWLRTNDPDCIGQIEAMTTLTTPKEKVSIVGAPQTPLHLVILVLRMASSTPLEGASDGHDKNTLARIKDQGTRPPGGGNPVPGTLAGVPGPTENDWSVGVGPAPGRQSER